MSVYRERVISDWQLSSVSRVKSLVALSKATWFSARRLNEKKKKRLLSITYYINYILFFVGVDSLAWLLKNSVQHFQCYIMKKESLFGFVASNNLEKWRSTWNGCKKGALSNSFHFVFITGWCTDLSPTGKMHLARQNLYSNHICFYNQAASIIFQTLTVVKRFVGPSLKCDRENVMYV